MKRVALLVATLLSYIVLADQELPAEPAQVDLTQWGPPDIATVGNDPFSTLVKYGRALLTDTANQIGPSVPDPAKRLTGNNLACQNCHLQAGTQPYAMPLIAFGGNFPDIAGERAPSSRSKIGSTAVWSAA
jgi:thiosulfate dehydrogenase